MKWEHYVPRILMAHLFMARSFGPEFAITQPEAEELAKAYAEWRKFYGGVFDPKTEALLNLVMVVGAIEGPRAMRASARAKLIRQQAAQAKQANAQTGAPNVVPIDGIRAP